MFDSFEVRENHKEFSVTFSCIKDVQWPSIVALALRVEGKLR